MRYKLDTSIPIHFEKSNVDVEDGRFTPVTIFLCHTGENLNGSFFEKSVIENMIPSLSNIPILGFISADNLNDADFNGHEERLVIDKDGIRTEYLGRAYGMIPETNNARFEFKSCEDGIEREFLVCDGLLWNKFNECIDIFDRDKFKSQSMELFPDSIEGKFEKDKLFHFTNAKFEGACILGEGIPPAMTGSVIEKFSISDIKTQINEMMIEIKEHFKFQNQPRLNNDGDDKVSKKGGNNMLEKVKEMLQKYNLTIEDISAKEIKHEDFSSIEELEEKVKEVFTTPKTQFSLTSEQLEDELRRELAEIETITEDWWGDIYKYPRYSYVDNKIDQNIVVARDCTNRYLVGFAFVLTNDNVEVDATSISRYKIDYNPMNLSGDADDPELGDGGLGDIVDELVDYALKRKEAELKKQFATEKEQFTAELSAKDATISEKEDAILSFDAKIQAITDDSKAKDATIETLTQFKKKHDETVRKEKVEALFAKFSRHLSKEEMEDFRNRESEFAEFETFEKEVKSFTCDRLVESVKEKTTEFSNMALIDNNSPENKTEDEPKDVFSKLEAKLKK